MSKGLYLIIGTMLFLWMPLGLASLQDNPTHNHDPPFCKECSIDDVSGTAPRIK